MGKTMGRPTPPLIAMPRSRCVQEDMRQTFNIEYTFVTSTKKFTRTQNVENFSDAPQKGDIIEIYLKEQDINTEPALFKVVKRIIPLTISNECSSVYSNTICVVCKRIEKDKRKRKKKTQDTNIIKKAISSLLI
jgi:hypothetical protein